jgi:hypothetical protein
LAVAAPLNHSPPGFDVGIGYVKVAEFFIDCHIRWGVPQVDAGGDYLRIGFSIDNL